MNFNNKVISMLSLLLAGVITVGGCASTKPYVSSKIGPIALAPSEVHRFTSITAYEKDGETVLFGDVRHEHAVCENSVHIDLASIDANGKILYIESVALRAPSMRQRGWSGAEFRTRISNSKLGEGKIHLAFHDTGCHKKLQYQCEDNQAEAHAMGPEEQR